MNKPETVLNEQEYEKIVHDLWEQIEINGSQERFDINIRLGPDIYNKIAYKIWSLKRYINTNYLNNCGLYLLQMKLDPYANYQSYRMIFTIEERDVGSRETKKTVEKLEEMVSQMYYSPGMPGYTFAKEDFEKKI